MSEYTGIQSGDTDHTQDLGLVVYLIMIFTSECNVLISAREIYCLWILCEGLYM